VWQSDHDQQDRQPTLDRRATRVGCGGRALIRRSTLSLKMSFTEDTESHEFGERSGGPVAVSGVAALGGILENPVEAPAEPSPGEPPQSDEAAAKIEAMKADLIGRADRMAAMADWTRGEFLTSAGCSGNITVAPEHLENYLLACISYFVWVEGMLGKVDLALDRRFVVLESTRLFSDGERDLADCEEAMRAGEEPTATQLLGLGEVTRAFQVACAHLHTPAGRHMRQTLLDDPDYRLSPHLDEERIALAWSDPELLGTEVAARVREHVAGSEGIARCEICASLRDAPRDEQT